MPPTDASPQSVIRHLTRLLSAVAHKSPNNEIRVKRALLDQLTGEGAARALFEDFDSKTEEVVLRFRPKSLATYLIEESQCPQSSSKSGITTTDLSSPSSQPLTVTSTPSPSTAPGRLPLTDQQVVTLENRLAKERHLRAIRREQQRSSNPLEGIL